MDEEKKISTQDDIGAMVIDSILEKPITFSIDGHFFYIYPPSLGVSLIASSLYKQMNIDLELMTAKKEVEAIRIGMDHRDVCLRIIALHSFADRKQAMDEYLVRQRIEELSMLDAAEVGCLMLELLDWVSLQERFIRHFNIDQEQKEKNRISEFKKTKSTSVSFGGRSIYGSLLDLACDKYKWTVDYVLWGVSVTTLNMMLADSVTSIYLTEDEAKTLNVSRDGVIIKMKGKKGKGEMKQLARHLRQLQSK